MTCATVLISVKDSVVIDVIVGDSESRSVLTR